MKKGIGPVFIPALLSVLQACSSPQPDTTGLAVKGQWITHGDGRVMQDPQTSGLVVWQQQLLTLSDGSGEQAYRLKLHQIDRHTVRVSESPISMQLSDRVQQGCFAEYLAYKPDFEALAVDPDDDKVFVLVTEDASRTGSMADACQQAYAQTGSTDYPTLLVRVELQADNSALMTHVRPLQYTPEMAVGDFPNDGIEGLAFAPDRTLYLGLEKDQRSQPRIFSLHIDENFWLDDGFAPVTDAKLKVPQFTSGNHPINGMDYMPKAGHPGYLVAAARNDDEIWWIDLSRKQPTTRVKLHFLAPADSTNGQCQPWEVMDNASIEGVAVDGDTLWLVNDPWKRNYLKNIVCEANAAHYEAMAPLLFKLDIQPQWFESVAEPQ